MKFHINRKPAPTDAELREKRLADLKKKHIETTALANFKVKEKELLDAITKQKERIAEVTPAKPPADLSRFWPKSTGMKALWFLVGLIVVILLLAQAC